MDPRLLAEMSGASEAVHVGTRVIALVYGALVPVHFVVLGGPGQWVMAAAALVTSLAALAGVRAARLPEFSPRWALWLVCSAPMVNSLLHMAVIEELSQTNMVMLSVVGIGAVMTSAVAAVSLTTVGIATWATIVFTRDVGTVGDVAIYGIQLGLACALGVAVFAIRAMTTARLRATQERLREQVQALAEMRAVLEEASLTDPLTGLLNRRGWDQRVAELLAHARRTGSPMCLALLDLDGFKSYNDTKGHQAGDDLLVAWANAVSAVLRAEDLVARWGGDELVVALVDCTALDAAAILDRARVALPGGATCSIGFAQLGVGETVAACLSRADLALYEAKERGRDCVMGSNVSTGQRIF